MSEILNVDGLKINLSRKRVKRINMRIKEPDGKILISAPFGTPDEIIIGFVRSKRAWIDRNIASIKARAEAHPMPATKAEKEALRLDLKRRIARRLPGIEEATGLKCSGWTVRDMRTRWGSCNTVSAHLNFSLALGLRSDAELDYVILHELVHTVVPNHGAEFYEMMDSFMPGWKKIRYDLRH